MTKLTNPLTSYYRIYDRVDAVLTTVQRNRLRKYRVDREAHDGMVAIRHDDLFLLLGGATIFNDGKHNKSELDELVRWCNAPLPPTAEVRLPAEEVSLWLSILGNTSYLDESDFEAGCQCAHMSEHRYGAPVGICATCKAYVRWRNSKESSEKARPNPHGESIHDYFPNDPNLFDVSLGEREAWDALKDDLKSGAFTTMMRSRDNKAFKCLGYGNKPLVFNHLGQRVLKVVFLCEVPRGKLSQIFYFPYGLKLQCRVEEAEQYTRVTVLRSM